MLLARLLLDVSPGMYIVGVPTVECESRDVYLWCAHYRMRARIYFLCDHVLDIYLYNIFRKMC